MSPIEMLRRALNICLDFSKQKYCYEYFLTKEDRLRGSGSYYILLTNNHFDMAVIAWVKLFGNKKSECFHFRNVLNNPDVFKAELLKNLGLDDAAWEKYWNEMKDFRDQFVAHLDKISQINVPDLYIASKSVEAYYAEVVRELRHAKQTAYAGNTISDFLKHNSGYFDESIDKIAKALAIQQFNQ